MKRACYWTVLVSVVIGSSGSVARGGPLTVVHFRGDYIGVPNPQGNRFYRGLINRPSSITGIDVNADGQVTNETILYWEFDIDDNPLSPLGLENGIPYVYLTDKPSAVFYGGIVARHVNIEYSGVPFTGQASLQNEGLTRITFGPTKRTGYVGSLDDDEFNYEAVYLWRKDGFLNGGDTGTISFDETSRLLVNMNLVRGNIGEVRFVVRDDGQFYMSEVLNDPIAPSFVNPPDHRDPLLIDIVPSVTDWALYDPMALTDPARGYDFGIDNISGVFGAHAFTDIDMLGLYVGRPTFGTDRIFYKFDEFRIDASVLAIPSPETLPVLVLLAAAIYGARWRRYYH